MRHNVVRLGDGLAWTGRGYSGVAMKGNKEHRLAYDSGEEGRGRRGGRERELARDGFSRR